MRTKLITAAAVTAVYTALVAVIAASNHNPGSAAAITIGVTAGLLLYWTPSFIALHRNVRGLGQVVITNLFFGWTMIGWVVALVLAYRPARPHAAH